MSSIRLQKIDSLLQKELGMIFQQKRQEHFGGLFISVTVVRTSPDLGSARVYVSILDKVDKAAVVKELNGRSGLIRKYLGASVGKQLRKTPELFFKLDDSLDYAEKINELLN
ncbi:MAG: 30S ribosome-binding factor RbfA [Bacteroidetes bacterium]|jgi:ribosome-binding factor A|nr:30S ribosome-binding factor RbfA [Bacteroidota bacterium]MDA0972250.1 30S ribosome-binding factor RbfA [Bacteroidota bacterium]